ncbi:MAG: alpha-galactosidase [Acidobacteria bacterium]|nr:MAG: alpha-galactosidase [Acidobacteriota bacterium]
MNRKHQLQRITVYFVLSGIALFATAISTSLALQQSIDNPLTGNWAASSPSNDGYIRKAYFNLKQDGGTITGTIRATQFFYKIVKSTGGPDGFVLEASMPDGRTERKVTYEGKLIGNELQIGRRTRPDQPITFQTAQRVPDGEGAMPARVEPPTLRKVPYNGLAKSPPMGWNSWNKFAGRIDDATVRGIADAISKNGMKEAGYVYINIDDTWEAGRDAQGNILTNTKFPDMKALADYVHKKGLKLGIYSSPGPNTCAGYEGSYGHEEQDARTYAAWGIDYLKYDWCGARILYTDEEMPAIYQKMGEALLKTKRPIVYSLCQYGRQDVWKWGPDVGGNLWRTTGDIRDTWDSMTGIGFRQNELAEYAKPGHWNDPDMLEIGNGGMTDVEYRTHMSLWAMLAAPLLAGNDLRNMTPATIEVLTNKEVIAVDQDRIGKQGRQVWKSGEQEIWTRPLSGGATAVAIFNRGKEESKVTLKWEDLGLANKKTVRDLWLHQDIATAGPEYPVKVAGHGVVMLRVK